MTETGCIVDGHFSDVLSRETTISHERQSAFKLLLQEQITRCFFTNPLIFELCVVKNHDVLTLLKVSVFWNRELALGVNIQDFTSSRLLLVCTVMSKLSNLDRLVAGD